MSSTDVNCLSADGNGTDIMSSFRCLINGSTTVTYKEEFFQHINTVDTSIQFTVEEARPEGSIPFMDILITPQADGTFTTKVYRKPTHTDRYLQWDIHHNLAAKHSVINTLTQKARIICSTPQLLNSELQDLERVLMQYKYPKWAINKVLKNNNTNRRTQPIKGIFNCSSLCTGHLWKLRDHLPKAWSTSTF